MLPRTGATPGSRKLFLRWTSYVIENDLEAQRSKERERDRRRSRLRWRL